MSDDKAPPPSIRPEALGRADSWTTDELAAPQQRAELLADAAKRRVVNALPAVRAEGTFVTTPPPELGDDAVDSVRNPPVSHRGEPTRMKSGIEAIVHPAEIHAFQRQMGEGRPGPKLFAYALGAIAVVAVVAAIIATLAGP